MFREENQTKCWRKTPQESNYHICPTKCCQRLKVMLKWDSEMLFWEPGTWHSCGGKTCSVGALTCMPRVFHFPFLVGDSEWAFTWEANDTEIQGCVFKIDTGYFFDPQIIRYFRRHLKDWNLLSLEFSPSSPRIRGSRLISYTRSDCFQDQRWGAQLVDSGAQWENSKGYEPPKLPKEAAFFFFFFLLLKLKSSSNQSLK